MEPFRCDCEADLDPKGADTLRALMLGSHSDITQVLDMEPPIDSGLDKGSSLSQKLTDPTDQGNEMDNRFSSW